MLAGSLSLTAVNFNPFAKGELFSVVPTTEPQKEIWLSTQMGNEANCSYNESQPIWLRGALKVDALRFALQQLVQRHEALRATFSPDGMLLCIARSLDLDLPLIDLSQVGDRDAQLTALLHQAVLDPFELIYGPLIRVQLVRYASEAHLLILTVYHLICDGWSWGVLLPDLAALYSAAAQGVNASLEAPESFSNYAISQAEQVHSPEALAAEQYWVSQFTGTPPVLELPTDRPRPALKTYNAKREDWELDLGLIATLKRTGAKARCSLFTTLLAGFEVFLHRLTGQTEIVVGVPAAGQSFLGKERLLGHCVNFLPMRGCIDGSQSFLDYARKRNSEILDAYDHQQMTFGSLVKKLAIPRDASRIPLVSAVFNYDRALSVNDLQFAGLEIELIPNPRFFENFDLFVNATESSGKFVLECQYNTDLFDAVTIRQRMAEFETLLAGIVVNPEQPIWQLPIVSAAQQQLLQAWNATEVDYPTHQAIHHLFEAQVTKTPDAIALVFENQTLTYRELNTRANQLAHHLQTLGVKPEVLVGICVDRSFDLLVGLLGILKAGGAYVPLDPAYPPERLAIILEDAQATVLLTQAKLAQTLDRQAAIVCLDTDWDTIAQQSQENLVNQVAATNLAYVIYTSGSTGRPKGVALEHRNAVAFITWAGTIFPVEKLTGVLASTSICFDLSVFELFFPLTVGGRIILARNILHLPTIPAAAEVSLVNTVPSAIVELLKLDRIPASVHTINLAGEPLSNKLVQQLYQLETVQQVYNLYGPSEDTTYSTVALMEKDSNQNPTIGRPIHNTQAHILDQHLQPVPIGVPGELHLSGAGLARGYLNRPDLTAERFINQNSQSIRLYKTGDLVRYLPNGTLEYLGRLDHQVKLRGFRIELGEVEAILSQHPAVQQTVVVVREDMPGNKRLVAYVVGFTEDGVVNLPHISELQAFLKGKLPDYMVPSALVVLDALPLTPNGKTDHKALPMPEMERSDQAEVFVAAKNQLEFQLIQLWEAVLGIKPIGVTDNFFELGGHSLMATSLLAQIERTFNQKLPLATIFQAPTIAQLATILKQTDWKPPCRSLVIIQPGGSRPPLFCIHVLGSGLSFYRPLLNYLERSQPVYGLSTQIMELDEAPPNQVERLAAFYIKELQTLQPEGPYLLTGVSFGGIVAYEMAQQLQSQGETVALVGMFDTFSAVQPKTLAFPQRVTQLTNLLQKGRPDVIWKKAKMRLEARRNDVKEGFQKTVHKAYQRIGRALPENLQNLAYEAENDEALSHYAPQPYSRRVILFKSVDASLAEFDPVRFDAEFGWRKILGDQLEVHTLPGGHLGMLKEPHVQTLGTLFNECLTQALSLPNS
ncbi:MAG: non-ribosomal peptide synthetase [Leptolyngbya sp.]|nr:MAG: non-ribosomal peptide synthetase [Leptolyngbya sp.]